MSDPGPVELELRGIEIGAGLDGASFTAASLWKGAYYDLQRRGGGPADAEDVASEAIEAAHELRL